MLVHQLSIVETVDLVGIARNRRIVCHNNDRCAPAGGTVTAFPMDFFTSAIRLLTAVGCERRFVYRDEVRV